MNRIIYFLTFIILTATDAIMGYKSAVTDFQITEPTLAVLFCLGFSMLSVPLKLIYDRLVEEFYSSSLGRVPFIIFSLLWLFLAFKSYEGISLIRQNNLRTQQLKSIAISEKKDAIIEPKTELEYRFFRYKEAKKAKLDSLLIAAKIANESLLLTETINQAKNVNTNGLYWFNLLLIVSASITLSLAMREPKTETKQDAKIEEIEEQKANIDKITDALNKTIEASKKPIGFEIEINKAIEPKMYHCKSCEKTFKSRQSYNGHFVNNITCEKLNFVKVYTDGK